ncbi:HlyD family efflux transporter periplasmic adaptor subunit [Microvirga rosea]|uniref:HlyD family efflux transporter periplasmic adaptor subunit n=1 Tax=Microvirga rosea TaxID=2715425 RepID=UPI001D0B3C62|nr:HlyD family efflux transporter periplasmic adaptor subunit [Microvirga rosea]MCB8820580.1 HlyD family efflux transporter periplasmic adaptor subunit [Microvirga rosea]
MAGALNSPITDAVGLTEETSRSSFAPLRDELTLEPGPSLRDGSPSWTLHDPAANRFFRIGWREFEILCRWHLGSGKDIAERIRAETALDADEDDVETFGRFLLTANLLRLPTAEGTKRLLTQKAARKQSVWAWLLHHYLFIRVPILRPDRALATALPRLKWLYSFRFLLITIIAALAGLYLALRQWDVFSASFPWFFSLEGASIAGLSLFLSKCLHELGHGLTAKRFGCRVPSMGVAFLVLTPVLYTDTTEAWRLRARSKRLAIGSAGVAAECCLAAYALLLWSFLPDGILRSVVFVWATTTWFLTVLINMSPFMRFDGYYLLADILDVPNLQERSFALARHFLREIMFAFGDPPPEFWSGSMRRILILYAVTTWIYRLVLFLGIAFLVYHMFFKALGIALFAVELWWFIAGPIIREFVTWGRRRESMKLNRQTIVTLSLVVLAFVIVVFPWRSNIHAPGLLIAQVRSDVFAHAAGQITAIRVKVGERVSEGDILFRIASPDITYKAAQAERKVQNLADQIAAMPQDAESLARSRILMREWDGAKAERNALAVELNRLDIRAPVSGTIVELADPLAQGEWVKLGEKLASIADLSADRIEAYMDETDLARIRPDRPATFIPYDATNAKIGATVVSVDKTALRSMSHPELASINGGPIASRQGANETVIPELPVYRVILEPHQPTASSRVEIGTVLLSSEPESLLRQAWRRFVTVLIRESGF